MDKPTFEKQLSDRGYGEPREHFFESSKDVDMHTHDFSAMLLVTEGEFRLVLEDGTHTFAPGDWCELEAGTLHTEKTGPDGAKTLLATRQDSDSS